MIQGDFWNNPDELVAAFEKHNQNYVFFITDTFNAAGGKTLGLKVNGTGS